MFGRELRATPKIHAAAWFGEDAIDRAQSQAETLRGGARGTDNRVRLDRRRIAARLPGSVKPFNP
jgi:hypothetical protein